MEFKSYIGLAAGILTAISSLPQIIKVVKDKKAQDVSPIMFMILLAGNGAWLYYGILIKDLPILITNAFSCILDLLMIYLNYRFKNKK
ncbi:SemiSWEET family sugar transporter [Pedobacter insulae]|uniref:SemiSWEET family sugar transporter n=1 Tax=Pedobacter insulae TaxID=414048 RepID=UPI000B8675B6|nr:SemiSWEET transporter [Pedobacter insulae]